MLLSHCLRVFQCRPVFDFLALRAFACMRVNSRVGEEKLLLPGATQLRSTCSSSAWEQHDELPFLPESKTSRELLLLQHVDNPAFRALLSGKIDGQDDTLFCGATVDGIVGVWRLQQAKPLILIRCELLTAFPLRAYPGIARSIASGNTSSHKAEGASVCFLQGT